LSTSLSVVVPAYNEGRRLPGGLEKLMDQVSPEDTEIIVVDDHSADDTASVARSQLAGWPKSTVVSLPQNRGKGAAVKAGVIEARGESIAFVDADMATDPGDLKSLVTALDHNHVAVGCRSHPGSMVERRGALRTVANRSFGMLASAMTTLHYTDTQCGFKAFRGPVAKLLFHGVQLERFAFDVDVLDLANRMGLRTEEVAVRWSDIPGSKVQPLRDGLQMACDVARMPVRRRRIPPVAGLWFRDVPITEAGALVVPHVRVVDLVVGWKGGTAVLFPCMPPSVAKRVSDRMASTLVGYRSEEMSVKYASLCNPIMATDIRSDEYDEYVV
jgi:hypothetical protein